MDMVPNREFRQVQSGRDFLIRQAFGNQGNESLLAQGETRVTLPPERPGLLPSDVVKQFLAQPRWAIDFTVKGGARRGNNVRSGRIVQKIARNARPDRSEELVRIVTHSDQYGLGLEARPICTRKVARTVSVQGIRDEQGTGRCEPRRISRIRSAVRVQNDKVFGLPE